jgi:hypothetical protein
MHQQLVVGHMQLNLLERTRILAALTGISLALAYFAMLWLDLAPGAVLPMLVTAIGGFELFLFSQDVWFKRRVG